jgi:hypothetical protein
MRWRSAKGAVINAAPKFRQKISESTGIELIAISGPDVPIPIIPIPKRIKSGRAGICVWLSRFKGCDMTVTVADTLSQ